MIGGAAPRCYLDVAIGGELKGRIVAKLFTADNFRALYTGNRGVGKATGMPLHYKLGDLKGALLDVEFAIRERKGNAKAYFPQGQANIALNDVDAAVESFKNALELEPNDGGIKKELAAANKRIADRRDQERKAYARMFQPKPDANNKDNEC